MIVSNLLPHKLLIFDLELKGHHVDYLHHIIIFKQKEAIPGILFIVVAPQFEDKIRKYIHDLSELKTDNIFIIPVLQEELDAVEQANSLAAATIKTWHIAKKYAEKFSVHHCVFMWLDHILQIPLALHWQFPCAISGICFRPMFHYSKFPNINMSRLENLKSWRQKILYFSAIRHTQLHTLFCLDPFVPKAINKLSRQMKAVHLPDPVAQRQDIINQEALNNLRRSLALDSKRKVFFFFFAIAARKGVFKLLDALSLLDDVISEKVAVLLIGEIVHNQDKQPITQKIERLKHLSAVQIVFRNNFVTDAEMYLYFSLADVVLAPYQKHVGMSGILLQAAAAGKPVISSNYGLMGQMIDTYSLGLAVNTELPAAIAGAIQETFSDTFKTVYDLEKMQQWVAQNSPDMFSRTIFDQIIKPNA